ncbi:MAG: hypothetical protein M0C28_33405 [Candidatus Moduliflexus flocculans]|nr:hypothetical protein [Candidatus Moduliflexus flocculans]
MTMPPTWRFALSTKTMFDVPRTIARVNNPNNAWLFNEKFKVDVALNSSDVLAHLIQEEMSLGDMMTLFRRSAADAIPWWRKKCLRAQRPSASNSNTWGWPKHCVIAAIIRDGVHDPAARRQHTPGKRRDHCGCQRRRRENTCGIARFPHYPARNGKKQDKS